MHRLAICIFALTALTASAIDASETLDRIREKHKIVVAHRVFSVPFSYLDAEGHPIGYAIDICANIVEAVRRELKLSKLDVEYLAITPGSRMTAIMDGKADLECGSTTNTAERRRQVDFSIPYFIASARAAVRRNSGIRNWPDLKGRKIVTTKGTTNAKTLTERNNIRSLNLSILEVDDHARGLLMVERGEADAFAMDDVLLYGLIASSSRPSDFAVIGEPLSIEPYAVMLRRGDAEFKQIVNGEIARLMNDGAIRTIYDKWFTHPIPPHGTNLNMPMGALLREFVRYPSDTFN